MPIEALVDEIIRVADTAAEESIELALRKLVQEGEIRVISKADDDYYYTE
jgi:hypothetical protein